MELELGLKITKTKDDIDSISEYQFMKDIGPVFQSRETNSMFILTAHLKGYKRNNIDIKINKDGSKITIRGEKPIQEMVMMGWVMQRKVVDVKGFNKVFKIPYGVNLDKIKANYNEEEWIFNIYMPKLVKGICGLKIEEVNEQKFEKGRSKQEKGEISYVSSSVGETSQKGSKDYEFQHMEGSENNIEKMIDDTIKEINKETKQNELGEPKLRIEDGNGENEDDIKKQKQESKLRIEDSKVKDIREKNGKETYKALKTLEIEKDFGKGVGETRQKGSKDYEIEHMEKMLDDTNKEINKETIQKEVGEYKLRIEDGNGEKVRVNVGKEQYEVMKKSELDQSVGVFVPKKIEDTSQDKEFEDKRFECRGVEKKEREEYGKRHHDANRDRVESTMKKEKEESKLRIEDSKVKDTREIEQNIGKGMSHNIVDTSQRVVQGSMIQQSGEPKEKEFGENKCNSKDRLKESMKESSMEQNVVDHIPNNIDSISQNEFEEPKVPQMEKTKSNERKLNGGESKKLPFEAKEDVQKTMFGDIIQKGIIRPNLESEDGDQECIRGKLGKEGFDDAKITINEEFDKYLPKESPEAREGLNVQKMQETEIVKENVVKRKGKEIEYFVEKGEDERLKRMHVEAKKGNTKEITQEEIQEIRKNGIKESGKQPVAEIEGSKGSNVAEVVKEALVETQCLMEKVEGEESKERTKGKRVEVEEEKIEYEIVRLKGQGSRNLNVEPNDSFEGGTTRDRIEKEIRNQKFQENVDIGIFDGRKTQKFQEIEQTEEFKENGENFEKSMKKLNGDKYQKIQLEFETKDRHKESSMEPFEPRKTTKLEQNVVDHIPNNIGCINQNKFKEEYENPPFEPKEVVQKTKFGDILKPKMETEDGDQECVGEKPNKEGFDAKITINEEFPRNIPKTTHEESEGLNVQKFQETKDVIENVAKRKGKKIEYFVEKSEGERLKRMHIEGKEGNNSRETMQEEIEESENEIKESGQQHAKENIVKEISEVSKSMTEEFQYPAANIDGGNGFNFANKEEQKEVAEEAFVETESLLEMVEVEESKERTMAKRFQDEEGKVKLNRERSKKLHVEANEPYEGDTTGERSGSIVQKMEETKDVNEMGAEIGKSAKKVNEKIQSEEDEGFKKNIKEKDECYLQEEITQGRSQESMAVKEDFPLKMIDSPIDTREGPNDTKEESEKIVLFVKKVKKPKRECLQEVDSLAKTRDKSKDEEIEETKELKGHMANTKSEEVFYADSTAKEELQGSKIEKNPKAIETRTSERELQSRKGPTTFGSVESIGFKEFDWSAKDKNRKFQCKETHESKDESVNQDFLNPKKPKEVGEQSEVETTEDQVVKPISAPRFQSTQQFEVEEKYPTKEFQNLIEMKENQEAKQKGNLKQETSLEKELKKGEKVEFYNGEKVREIDDRDQQYVPRDHGNVEPKEKDMLKEWKTTQNVNDEKSKIHGEVKKAGIEKVDKEKCIHEAMKTTQEKEHSTKLKVDAKEAESFEEIPRKELSPLREEMKRKRPLELEKAVMEWKFPKTIDEINRKSECTIEEHEAAKVTPGLNIVETEKINSLQPLLLDVHEKNDTKGFQTPKTLEEEKVVKKTEGSKIAKSEETKYASTLKREKGKTTQITEEKKPKMKKTAPQLDMASGSKRVLEKVQEAHELLIAPKMDNEISKVGEEQEEKEGQKNIHVLETTFSKEEDRTEQKGKIDKPQENQIPSPKEPLHSIEESTSLEVVADKVAQQFEVEGEEKTKKRDSKMDVQESSNSKTGKEIEQCIIKDEETKHGIEEQKECKDETSGWKKDNKIPKVEQVKEVESHIHVLEATISKEKDRVVSKEGTGTKQNSNVPKNSPPKEPFQESKVPSSQGTQQFEVEGEEKTKKKETKTKSNRGKEVEQCIIKYKDAKHGKEKQKEGQDETSGWKKDNEIPKLEQEKEVKSHIYVLEAPISKEKNRVESKEDTGTKQNYSVPKNSPPKEPLYSMDGTTAIEAVAHEVVQESKVPSSSSTQQFEVEGEEKTKKNKSKIDVQESIKSKRGQEVVEQCINKDEESKYGREEIDEEKEKDYEQVYKDQNEGKDETSGGKKDNAKLSKKLFAPLVIAGSALLVTLVVIFVRHRRSRKGKI